VWKLRDEHPAAAADGADPFRTEAPTDADDEGVAAAVAQVGDPGPTSELTAAEDAAGVALEDVVHGPLLRSQMLEGVRIRLLTFGGTHRSGPCHVDMQDPERHSGVRRV
jgi:hypothetical protein